jgi:hypothetical protein
MEKKNTSMRLKPSVAKDLRILSAFSELSQGDVLEALIKFQDSGKLLTGQDRELFNKLWEQAVVSVKHGNSGWTGKPARDDGAL